MSKVLGGCLAAVVVAALVFAIEAWWLMLLLGILHLEVAAAIPALGFGQTVWVVLALNAVGGILRGATSSSKETK